MDERRALKIAEQYARSLHGRERLSYDEAQNRAVAKFFAESGIPKDLARGWAIYQQRRETRAKVGAALPPGAVLLLGDASVIAAVLAEAHTALATRLRLPASALQLRIDSEARGRDRGRLLIDVRDPGDWVIPVTAFKGQDPTALAKQYLSDQLDSINVWFRQTLRERLRQCRRVRGDVRTRVKPWIPSSSRS
jgi:hypothetical protein